MAGRGGMTPKRAAPVPPTQPQAKRARQGASPYANLPIAELVDLGRQSGVDISGCMTRVDLLGVIPPPPAAEGADADNGSYGDMDGEGISTHAELETAVALPPRPGADGAADPAAAAEFQGRQLSGEVKNIQPAGFGFISCDETRETFGRDVWVSTKDVQEVGLAQGDQVKFTVYVTPDGKAQARDVTRSLPPGRYQGVVKSLVLQPDGKGYGFITCDDTHAEYGCDVWIGARDAVGLGLGQGSMVEFGVKQSKQGKPQAADCRAIGAHPAGMPPNPYAAPHIPVVSLPPVAPPMVPVARPMSMPSPMPRPVHVQVLPSGIGGKGPGKGKGAGGAGGEWVCPSCGFKNRANNDICGGHGHLGCKQPRPAPQPAFSPPAAAPGDKWVCPACGFKNRESNDICGGHGTLGCKAPKPEIPGFGMTRID